MANINQTIIIRTDLFNLPDDLGLIGAQIAHIHFEMSRVHMTGDLQIKFGKNVNKVKFIEWLNDPYLLVKRVPNREGLEYFLREAESAKLPTAKWVDTVYVRLSPTIKKAFPKTLVGISIGPEDADSIRSVVGDLPLL